jgi:hypothetical protein
MGEGLWHVWPVTRSVTRMLTSDVSGIPLRLRRNAELRFLGHVATGRYVWDVVAGSKPSGRTWDLGSQVSDTARSKPARWRPVSTRRTYPAPWLDRPRFWAGDSVQRGGPGGMTAVTGVNVTVDPLVCARHGLGGWMLISARLGNARRLGGPGGVRISSMLMMPPAVSMVVRV